MARQGRGVRLTALGVVALLAVGGGGAAADDDDGEGAVPTASATDLAAADELREAMTEGSGSGFEAARLAVVRQQSMAVTLGLPVDAPLADLADALPFAASLAAGEVSVSPPSLPPSDAARRLVSRFGVVTDEAQEADLLLLDTLPPEEAGALAAAFIAFDALVVETGSAIPAVVSDPLVAATAGWREHADPTSAGTSGDLLAAGGRVLELLDGVQRAQEELAAALVTVAEALSGSTLPVELAVPPLLLVDLGADDDVYDDGFHLLIDAGGDDLYRNNAGGSQVHGCSDLMGGAAALLDVDGDDQYPGHGGCGTVGSGSLGAGLLVDAAGADTYRGDNGLGDLGAGMLIDLGAGGATRTGGCTGTTSQWHLVDDLFCGPNGAGRFGSGFLLDAGGDDEATVDGTAWAPANGGGFAGRGLLVDAGGNDRYRGHNGGGHVGSGLLVDTAGDDAYRAASGGSSSSGSNGGGYEGTGILIDVAGVDTYEVPALDPYWPAGGLNGGGWAGLGTLADGSGDDTYRAAEGAATNGSGAIGGGLLVDAGGDDRYAGDNGSAILGTGLLLDHAGDDTYTGGNGIGDLGPALLLDRSGRDLYSDGTTVVEDCSQVPKGEAGAQLDLPRSAACP